MTRAYRGGAVGALMDEYERAAAELIDRVERVSAAEFERIADPHTADADCRSIQTILAHVVSAGYGYADSLREAFSIPSERPEKRLPQHGDAAAELRAMLGYTARTLEGRWEMADDEIERTMIRSRWGVMYDLEQLLEHAIVHVLRHRRQVERFLQERETSASEDA